MSRKDYIKCAALIASLAGHDDLFVRGVLAQLRDGLCDLFKADNPAFDRARFIAACEPKPKSHPSLRGSIKRIDEILREGRTRK